jgi:hypothetical protein
MSLPSADTPLYNHPLPEIEQWLISKGCERDRDDVHCWRIHHADWSGKICLDVDSLTVCYFNTGEAGRDIHRSFKYSLSRQDLDEAIFSGP